VGVPLLVRYPPSIPAGARVESPVSTLGAFATILDLADIEPPPTLQVASLAPLARGDSQSNGGPIVSELHDRSQMGARRELPDPQMKMSSRWRLLREGNLKLVASSDGTNLLYDLSVDPDESRDLSAERPEDLARMVARMAEVQISLALPALDAALAIGEDAPELDAATQEQLRLLGYIE
jgi:arylsulfatase A-like enzyme